MSELDAQHAADAEAAEPAEPEIAESPARAVVGELDTLAQQPVAEHPRVYERIHAELQSALSAIDDA